MARPTHLNRLSITSISKAKSPCILQDGGGLQLIITSETARKWVLRYTFHGRRQNIGLGNYPVVDLNQARATAEKHRRQVRDGIDPIAQRAIERGNKTTFRETFDLFWQHKKLTLSNGKHVWQWTQTMENHVFPKIGHRSVADITANEILSVLRPIWHEIPETASRTLQRMRAVFETAIVLGLRDKADPCTGITRILGPANKEVRHHPSLEYARVPAFIRQLRQCSSDPITKLAFEFLILTAARPGEVRLADICEIDMKKAVWTIPAARMKSRREHIVPLSSRALEICKEARKITGEAQPLLFPNPAGLPYSDMVFVKMMRDWGIGTKVTAHGFRATFKTWCAEIDKVRDEVSEVALAHVDKDKVREAYKRALYLDERRPLMQRWTAYALATPTSEGKNRKKQKTA